MKKTLLILIITIVVKFEAKSQVVIDSVSLISAEETNTEFAFNNTKLMAGNNISDRYIVYYNSDTIFLNVYQSGYWTKKIAYTGNNIKSATLSLYKDTIWVCWKEGAINTRIKTRYSPDIINNIWSPVLFVSLPSGDTVAAPSVYASSNGKIHFVWSAESLTNTTVYHRMYSSGTLADSAYPLSNLNARGLWPSVIATGDTVLCAWKEEPLPTKVWFARSFNGGESWSLPDTTSAYLSITKDPNLAYAYNSAADSHYVYLAYDGKNKIYLQRSTDFGNTWSSPDTISNPYKLSQFAHLECNNSGFVGVSYEHRTDSSLTADTAKDVGFVFSTSWGNSGSFGNDSLAYTNNSFGSAYPAFNKIDENNFYLAWLTKDTIADKTKIFERHIYFNNPSGINNSDHTFSTNINIFPNPATGVFSMILPPLANNTELYIINTIGQKVFSQFHQANAKETCINVNPDLPSGIYFAILKNKMVLTTQKFIIL